MLSIVTFPSCHVITGSTPPVHTLSHPMPPHTMLHILHPWLLPRIHLIPPFIPSLILSLSQAQGSTHRGCEAVCEGEAHIAVPSAATHSGTHRSAQCCDLCVVQTFFDQVDTDHSGTVDAHEIAEMVRIFKKVRMCGACPSPRHA